MNLPRHVRHGLLAYAVPFLRLYHCCHHDKNERTTFLLLASVIIGIATSKVINHPGVPTEWIRSGRVEPNAKIQLIIAISQSEVGKENLETELLARSDPENKEMYGKWMPKEQIDNMLRNPTATDAVAAFVRSHFNGPQDSFTLTSGGDFCKYKRLSLKQKAC